MKHGHIGFASWVCSPSFTLSPWERAGVRAEVHLAQMICPLQKSLSPHPHAKGDGARTIRLDLRAFTLIEMVVSLTIISIVFLAMGSVMVLAAKAIPDPDGPIAVRHGAADVLEQIASELQVATSVLAASATGIEFTVPDRDSDNTDETIKYKWNGSAGDPLYRQYNGGTAVAVLSACNGFELVYDTKAVTTAGEPVTSAEVVLASHGSAVDRRDFDIRESKWIGQYLVPQNLPADALTWSVTRVYISAASSTMVDGTVQVQLRQAGPDDLPTSVVIEANPMYEWNLSTGSYNWQGFTFSDVRGYLPDSCVCLVLQWQAGNVASYIQYDNQSGSGNYKTTTGDSGWSMDNGKSMVYYLYGTYTTPGTTTAYDILRSVSMTLKPSSDLDSQARSSAVVLNQPQMP